jgi:hypothetical protein
VLETVREAGGLQSNTNSRFPDCPPGERGNL